MGLSLIAGVALPAGPAAAPLPAPVFEIFAMDNGVGRGEWSAGRRAAVLQDTGFDGISYNYTTPGALREWLAELAKRKLKLYGLYFTVRLQGDTPWPAGLAEAVRLLEGTGTVLWFVIPAPKEPGDHEAEALRRVREIADLAAGAHLRAVLYPHRGFYVTTAEQAFALVTQADRANLGVTVNLAHELAAGNGARLPEIIRRVAPRLERVTINGATDRPGPGWSNYIKLLGEGDYDVAAVLRTLADVRYRGPVGVQFYSLKGDSQKNLETTMRAWRGLIP